MATTRFILGIFCLIGAFGNWLPNRNLLGPYREVNRLTVQSVNCLTVDSLRGKLIAIAESQLGVRETSGNNRGREIKTYLAYTQTSQGNPWCAAFVSWVYGQAGYHQPKTAWSPALFPTAKLTQKPKPADVFGIYGNEKNRIVHCGMVENIRHNWIITIEGNTNVVGSNDGDGVYRKWRHRKTITTYSNWLKQKGGENE